jgi:hypothetical protein
MSHAMWACAKIGIKNTRFLQAAAAALLQESEPLGSVQLRQIAWATAKLHLKFSNSQPLVQMLLQQSMKVLHLSSSSSGSSSSSSSSDRHQHSSSSSSSSSIDDQQCSSSSARSTAHTYMQQQQQQQQLSQADRANLAVVVSFAAAVLNARQLSHDV